MKLRSLLKDKKGMTLGDIYPAVLTLVLIGIVLGIGIYILASISSELSSDVTAAAAVNTTMTGLADFAGWIAIIVVVIAAAIVLGIVLSSFGQGTRV